PPLSLRYLVTKLSGRDGEMTSNSIPVPRTCDTQPSKSECSPACQLCRNLKPRSVSSFSAWGCHAGAAMLMWSTRFTGSKECTLQGDGGCGGYGTVRG